MAPTPGGFDIKELMETCVKEHASDLHLTVGRPPILRKHGRLIDIPGRAVLKPEDTEGLVKQMAPERSWKEAQEVGSADFAVAHSKEARFRVNIYRQKGFWGTACRLIPSQLLTFEEIGLSDVVKELITRPRGLVLVTGPTGSGKTTTMATMVNYLNQNFDRHIVTIEDPVEYYHQHDKSMIMQRELHVDVPSFAEGMRRALRQDPNIILLGEMRDLETISSAITAAETGHLVLATLHTTGAARTVDRIIDAFPTEAQEQIRAQLSVSLIAVISQVLLPRCDKPGRVAAFEIMIMNPAVENHIRKNETFKIPSVLQTSRRLGMVLLDDHLLELFKAGKIDRETALRAAQQPKDLEPKLV
ncbi:MAG TPA: type IV pilus twitching motility protein PilT [Planctomycetota bacterium]|jgi:twitching motility protein PilT|nr:type IV pilus twitching motility protein PilT [Planctomycetota bacterium]